jgi:hypothetical protein
MANPPHVVVLRATMHGEPPLFFVNHGRDKRRDNRVRGISTFDLRSRIVFWFGFIRSTETIRKNWNNQFGLIQMDIYFYSPPRVYIT